MTAFEKRTIERFKTLGERLAKVREEAGYSPADVQEATGIRAEYIEAIERGRYTQLPGSVYIESYLKRYAAFLEVDPQYVLDLYRQGEARVIRRNQQERFTPKPQQLPKEIVTPSAIGSGCDHSGRRGGAHLPRRYRYPSVFTAGTGRHQPP